MTSPESTKIGPILHKISSFLLNKIVLFRCCPYFRCSIKKIILQSEFFEGFAVIRGKSYGKRYIFPLIKNSESEFFFDWPLNTTSTVFAVANKVFFVISGDTHLALLFTCHLSFSINARVCMPMPMSRMYKT